MDDQLTFNQMVGGVTDPRWSGGGRRERMYPVRAARGREADGKVIVAAGNDSWAIAAG